MSCDQGQIDQNILSVHEGRQPVNYESIENETLKNSTLIKHILSVHEGKNLLIAIIVTFTLKKQMY